MPKRRLQLIPVDVQERRTENFHALMQQLERSGNLRVINPAKMLQAKALYVRKMMSRRRTAKAVGVPLEVIDRWADSFGWDAEKKKIEFEWFQKVSEVRRKTVDIDERHDQMFHDLETLIEDTLRVMRKNNTATPRDISVLAGALRVTMEGRRTVRKMEGPATRKVIEFQNNPQLLEEFIELANELALPNVAQTPPRISAEVAAVDHSVAEDVEFEELDG